MKKLSIVIVLLFICTILCSCGTQDIVYVEGIENYKIMEGDYEINVHLLPSEDFLDKYAYTSAQYNHKEIYRSRMSIFGKECSLIVANYDAEQYALAKEHCLQNFRLINSFEYNGYVFAENILLPIGQGRVENDKVLHSQEWFNMFAYNDEDCCLVFVGAYMLYDIAENTKTDPAIWGEFWQEYFAEFYEIN